MDHLTKKSNKFAARILAAVIGAGMLAWATPSLAIDVPLPPVNLGGSSFTDGIAFPGLLVEETIGYYHADHLNNHAGNEIPGSNKLTSVSAATHVAYLSEFRLLGGLYGAEFVLPLVDVDLDTSFGPNRRVRGVGDFVVSPFIIQWADHKLFGLPYFHRFAFAVSLPTGKYESDQPVNLGSNVYSINPYYAFTILPTPKAEVSIRLQYLWNSENDDPFVGLGANDVQPGQAVHINYAASYEVLEGFRLGFAGYALQQITDDKVDGRSQAESKEKVFGIGPGFELRRNGFTVVFNGYYETGVENRPEGISTYLRVSTVF